MMGGLSDPVYHLKKTGSATGRVQLFHPQGVRLNVSIILYPKEGKPHMDTRLTVPKVFLVAANAAMDFKPFSFYLT